MFRSLAIFLLSLVVVINGFKIQPRIVNGIEGDPKEFPSYVFIESDVGRCGGSLLSDGWVLTVGHCTISRHSFNVYLGFGSYEKFDQNITVEPSNQYTHPQNILGSSVHDIGLIKLPHGVKLGENVQAAKLPTDCQSPAINEAVIVAGAGIDKIHRLYDNPPVLRYAHTHTIACTSSRVGDGLELDSLICAQVVDSQSAYSGDSGGPMIREEDGTLIGTLAFVIEDDEIYDFDNHIHYQVSTNIRYYFDWIADVTGLDMPKC